jgi:hypothetical protein
MAGSATDANTHNVTQKAAVQDVLRAAPLDRCCAVPSRLAARISSSRAGEGLPPRYPRALRRSRRRFVRVGFFISHSVPRHRPSRTLQQFSTVNLWGVTCPGLRIETTPRRLNDLYPISLGRVLLERRSLKVRRPPSRSGKSRGIGLGGARELQTTKSALYRGQHRRRAPQARARGLCYATA